MMEILDFWTDRKLNNILRFICPSKLTLATALANYCDIDLAKPGFLAPQV